MQTAAAAWYPPASVPGTPGCVPPPPMKTPEAPLQVARAVSKLEQPPHRSETVDLRAGLLPALLTVAGAFGRALTPRHSFRPRYPPRVHLTPSDQEKLLLSVAGIIARDRRERGVKLNYPESVALISCWVIERAREGASVEQLMSDGRDVLTREELMDGIPDLLDEVQVEATFPDGRKLVTIHDPVR